MSLVALLMGAALLTRVAAQPAAPALEVASVKKHKGQQDGMARFTVSGSNVTVVALQMHDLILEAFNLKPYQVSGEQDWMGGGSSLADMVTRSRGADSYDISAKAEGDGALTRDQGRVILQAVLADRFHLKVHRETRDLPVYALVVGKNGPKLKESAPDTKFAAGLEMRPSARMTNTKTPMARLAEFLSIQADRPVVDRTGLTGVYDFTLEWNLTDGQQSAVGAPKDADSSGPSLFTAVQEQLGLKLETAKAPIEILVIDHAQKPTGN
jgi:bla regulator protein blaR1